MKRKTIIRKLDTVFSKWVRLSHADHAGYLNCYTCGVTKHWREVDAGHFRTRAAYSTRWLDWNGQSMNVKPQCKKCNGFRSGESYIFGCNLNAQYGEGTAEEITLLSNQIQKFTNEELQEKIKHYSSLVNKMQ
jgi:hypothetical protein